MYLSKLLLNPRSRAIRRDEANPYEMHSSLCYAFQKADEPTPADNRDPSEGKTVHKFLWRLEPSTKGASILLVQSETEPQWDTFAERNADYFSHEVETKRLPLEHLTEGQHLRFRLRANPTVTKRHEDRPNKQKRVGLYKPEDLLGYTNDDGEWIPGWLERQAQRSGFDLLAFDVTEVEHLRFFKHKGGNPITLQSTLFDGYLKINDLEQFKKTLVNGVGKAKALGFGLLSVARA